MLRITLKRSIATAAVLAGFLATALPVSASAWTFEDVLVESVAQAPSVQEPSTNTAVAAADGTSNTLQLSAGVARGSGFFKTVGGLKMETEFMDHTDDVPLDSR